MQRRIITLLSDFGSKDPYVAEMKAAILTKCSEVTIVDISHEIDAFDVRMGAFVLASAAPFFPKGTIHLAVVDPGVGTKRRPIIVETSYSRFVGPDNGLLMLAASKQTIKHVYAIESSRLILTRISKTFHGRDIFAPVAAYLAKGCVASELGGKIEDFVTPGFARSRFEKEKVFGEVLHIDRFGNIVSNISSELLGQLAIRQGESIKVKIGKKVANLKLASTYGDVPQGKPLALVGSHDFLEFSVNQGSAAAFFEAEKSVSIHVSKQIYR